MVGEVRSAADRVGGHKVPIGAMRSEERRQRDEHAHPGGLVPARRTAQLLGGEMLLLLLLCVLLLFALCPLVLGLAAAAASRRVAIQALTVGGVFLWDTCLAGKFSGHSSG